MYVACWIRAKRYGRNITDWVTRWKSGKVKREWGVKMIKMIDVRKIFRKGRKRRVRQREWIELEMLWTRLNVRVRVLTIEYRAVAIHPIDPSPAPTTTATRTSVRVTVTVTFIVIVTVIATVAVNVRIDAVVAYCDSVAWRALILIHTVRKAIHQPSW